MKRFSLSRVARLFGLSLILCAALCASASAYEFVFDDGLIRDEDYVASLESQAREIADTYDVGVYLIIVNNFEEYGYSDPYDCAVAFYEDTNMGIGENHDGELLFMSMEDRQYALVYTGYGEIAFTEGGRDILEEAILSHFRNDDWEGGFTEYYRQSEYLLSQAASGEPVGWDEYGDYHPDDGEYQYEDDGPDLFDILITLGICAVISGLICMLLVLQLESVHKATEAQGYVAAKGLNLRTRDDRFTHVTESRVKVTSDSDSDSGSGSTHHSGGGHSGRSGSF